MSPELDRALCEAHPELFRERHGDISQTAMAAGFECGDGWYSLISSLCQLIERPYTAAKLEYESLSSRYVECSGQSGGVEKLQEVEAARRRMLMARATLPAARQVKSKLGTLRFYLSNENARTTALVEFAEHHSGKVCEVCGSPGRLRGGEGMATRCDSHALDMQIERGLEAPLRS